MIKEGFPLDKKLHSILREILSTQDVMDVSVKVNLSFSTVRDLYYRTGSVTQANKKAAFELIEAALIKIPLGIESAKEMHNSLMKIKNNCTNLIQ